MVPERRKKPVAGNTEHPCGALWLLQVLQTCRWIFKGIQWFCVVELWFHWKADYCAAVLYFRNKWRKKSYWKSTLQIFNLIWIHLNYEKALWKTPRLSLPVLLFLWICFDWVKENIYGAGVLWKVKTLFCIVTKVALLKTIITSQCDAKWGTSSLLRIQHTDSSGFSIVMFLLQAGWGDKMLSIRFILC